MISDKPIIEPFSVLMNLPNFIQINPSINLHFEGEYIFKTMIS